jgi:hypothetical protein
VCLFGYYNISSEVARVVLKASDGAKLDNLSRTVAHRMDDFTTTTRGCKLSRLDAVLLGPLRVGS